eukprot:318513-Pyramimonas_sp.AAC.1
MSMAWNPACIGVAEGAQAQRRAEVAHARVLIGPECGYLTGHLQVPPPEVRRLHPEIKSCLNGEISQTLQPLFPAPTAWARQPLDVPAPTPAPTTAPTPEAWRSRQHARLQKRSATFPLTGARFFTHDEKFQVFVKTLTGKTITLK